MPLLDLSQASDTSFDPFSSGTYDAVVYEAKMDEIKNKDGNGKLPAGTPMIKVQFKITGGPAGNEFPEDGVGDAKPFEAGSGEDYKLFNRRVFRNYIIPPAKLDGKKYEHYEMMNGMLVRFLTSLGFTEEEVKAGDFDLNLEDLAGRECRVVVATKQYKPDPENEPDKVITQNEVKGTKPAGAPAVGGLI